MEQDIKQFGVSELVEELRLRGCNAELLEQFDSDDLKEELRDRGDYYEFGGAEDMDDAELLDELESRGHYIPDGDIKALVRTIYQQKRTGRPFDVELDRLIYEITGRFI